MKNMQHAFLLLPLLWASLSCNGNRVLESEFGKHQARISLDMRKLQLLCTP